MPRTEVSDNLTGSMGWRERFEGFYPVEKERCRGGLGNGASVNPNAGL